MNIAMSCNSKTTNHLAWAVSAEAERFGIVAVRAGRERHGLAQGGCPAKQRAAACRAERRRRAAGHVDETHVEAEGAAEKVSSVTRRCSERCIHRRSGTHTVNSVVLKNAKKKGSAPRIPKGSPTFVLPQLGPA